MKMAVGVKHRPEIGPVFFVFWDVFSSRPVVCCCPAGAMRLIEAVRVLNSQPLFVPNVCIAEQCQKEMPIRVGDWIIDWTLEQLCCCTQLLMCAKAQLRHGDYRSLGWSHPDFSSRPCVDITNFTFVLLQIFQAEADGCGIPALAICTAWGLALPVTSKMKMAVGVKHRPEIGPVFLVFWDVFSPRPVVCCCPAGAMQLIEAVRVLNSQPLFVPNVCIAEQCQKEMPIRVGDWIIDWTLEQLCYSKWKEQHT